MKIVRFTRITILSFAIILPIVNGCEKLGTTHGVIVGYTKCNAGNDSALIGLFIITEKKDSLLSFNVPLASIGIDQNSLSYGAYGMERVSVSFDYKIAVGKEIKQDFLCPQNTMLPSTLPGLIEDYTQIILHNIKR